MRKIHVFIVLIFSFSYSQDLVEFTLGSGYEYDIFFSLNEGLSGYADRSNWDLAFTTDQDPENANIRINSGNDVTLFKVIDPSLSWEEVSSQSDAVMQLRNSNFDWSIGAFVSDAVAGDNCGWGIYNPTEQTVIGNSIYIINYAGQTKKIRINSLINGEFSITLADLNGSNEHTVSIPTSNSTDKNFIYYGILNDEIIDREPVSEDWDIVFTRYEEDLYLDTPDEPFFYKVQGALTNTNNVSQFDGNIFADVSVENLVFSTNISTIGYDWKEYGSGFIIVPNRSYYIYTQDNQSLFRIIFQSYDGMSTGNMSFTYEQVFNVTSMDDLSSSTIKIYPNPNNGNFFIEYNGNNARLNIMDFTGKIVFSNEINSSQTINMNNFSKGVYFLNLFNDQSNIVKQFLVK